MFDQRLIRLRPPTKTASDGSVEPDWRSSEATWDKQTYWCSFQPVGTTEELTAQQRVETTHIGRVEPRADITAVDRVRVYGKDHTIQGDPLDFRDGEAIEFWRIFCQRITGG